MTEMHFRLSWIDIIFHKIHLIANDINVMLLRRILPSRDRSIYFFIADNDILNDPHDHIYSNSLTT